MRHNGKVREFRVYTHVNQNGVTGTKSPLDFFQTKNKTNFCLNSKIQSEKNFTFSRFIEFMKKVFYYSPKMSGGI
jgi:hypothetical protein